MNELLNRVGVLREAEDTINGPRQVSYGDPIPHLTRIGKVWGVLLGMDYPIPPAKVALMMVGLKTVREAHRHSRDDLVDIAGYTALVGRAVGEP